MYLGSAQDLGAVCLPGGGVRFRVWAPFCGTVSIKMQDPHSRVSAPLVEADHGWFELTIPGLAAGVKYWFVLDGMRERPDPASRALPAGVHGPSEVVDTSAFVWTDAGWRGVPLSDWVIYELHVGTFTPEGTFDAVIPRLQALRDLGITAIELMPVASFPGSRSWGYDSVGLYAPQRSYGGPAGLQRLIDACHREGLAVLLDVVYNHLGPEGNYLAEFGPYYTDRYETPWGRAINYDGEDAGPVRQFVIENALYWVREYHADGLRLDAVHSIFDHSPVHILRELNDAVRQEARRAGRIVPLIAESDLNDRRIIAPVGEGGLGLAAQWSDDFHHALHAVLTGERQGYYADFGSLDHLARAFDAGFVYEGQHSAFRGRPHGTPAKDLPMERFVVCAQNHDQVGNRARGERLSALIVFEALKLAAAAALLSPYVPLLFMGEEYGETAPFLFFTDFDDPALRVAVSRGRRQEFEGFGWTGEVPDPQEPTTFLRSRLDWALQHRPPHASLRAFYAALLALRRSAPIFQPVGERPGVWRIGECVLQLTRGCPDGTALTILFNFSPGPAAVRVPFGPGAWRRLLDSAEERFGGSGAPSPPRTTGSGQTDSLLDLAGWGALVYLQTPEDPQD